MNGVAIWTIIVNGAITIVGLVCGVAILWLKIKEAACLAAEAKTAAAKAEAAALVSVKETAEVKAEVKATAATGAKTAEVADLIHDATNSNWSRMERVSEEQRDQLVELRERVEMMHAERLAQQKLLPAVEAPAVEPDCPPVTPTE